MRPRLRVNRVRPQEVFDESHFSPWILGLIRLYEGWLLSLSWRSLADSEFDLEHVSYFLQILVLEAEALAASFALELDRGAFMRNLMSDLRTDEIRLRVLDLVQLQQRLVGWNRPLHYATLVLN